MLTEALAANATPGARRPSAPPQKNTSSPPGETDPPPPRRPRRKRVVLHHMNFKGKVSHCEFSPCGRTFAVCVGKLVQIWATPTMLKEFAPFRLLRTYGRMYDEATCLAWSPDSRWIIVALKTSPRGYTAPTTWRGTCRRRWRATGSSCATCRSRAPGGDAAYTVSKDGALFEWRLVDETEDDVTRARRGDKGQRGGRDSLRGGDGVTVRRWRMEGKHFFHMPAKLTCAAYHPGTGMLCAGFGHGVFTLHRLSPGSFEVVHTLSISQQKVSACQWNETGDWIARLRQARAGCRVGVAVGSLRVQAAGALLRREHVRVRTGREYDSDGG